MKAVRCAFIAVLFAALLTVAGCLTAEQRQRIEDLSQQNEALVEKQRALVEKVRLGTATQAEIADAFTGVANQIKKNAEEIKAIKDSGSTGAWLAAAAGILGRTALHAAGAMIPGGTPVAGAIQGLLTLLLGGSETRRKEEETE
jgi:hypothetical protein